MSKEAREVTERLHAVFNDDLDTPKALAVLWEVLKSQVSSLKPDDQSAVITFADQVLGLGLTAYLGKPLRIPREVHRLVAAREEARAAKDWARADVLRAQIQALGFHIEDTTKGPVAKNGSGVNVI